ncbi:MAG: hypothetical protein ACR2M9_03750 [Cyanophyceae cyanobacterium]
MAEKKKSCIEELYPGKKRSELGSMEKERLKACKQQRIRDFRDKMKGKVKKVASDVGNAAKTVKEVATGEKKLTITDGKKEN